MRIVDTFDLDHIELQSIPTSGTFPIFYVTLGDESYVVDIEDWLYKAMLDYYFNYKGE